MPDAAFAPLDAAAALDLLRPTAGTPLQDLEGLGARLGVAAVLVKDESRRPLGNFKSLGGVPAALRALSQRAGRDVADLLDPVRRPAGLPALVCASDGNHGLAVAAAARVGGVPGRVYLPRAVAGERVRRIAACGAQVIHVAGTYDDAVGAAAAAARAGGDLLISDTTADPGDTGVRQVMRGYARIPEELGEQLAEARRGLPTHLFVQAGVGGLAAALAGHRLLDGVSCMVLVEPERAACVGAALAAGHPVRIAGDLTTVASMLSCGEASAPAVEVLRRRHASAIAVPEPRLEAAPRLLRAAGGPATTPSGAAGLAGLVHALADPAIARRLGLGPSSRVLLIVTEGPLGGCS